MALPKVVIVGGGVGGVHTARALQGAADVTLVEPKGFFQIIWATPRALVDAKFLETIVFAYDSIPGIGTLIRGRAVSFTDSAVTLDGGKTLPFDYLVLAMGSTYPSAAIKDLSDGSVAQHKAGFQAEVEKLRAASSVLIIGGGPVGVELAGEIVTDLPGKQVTLLTSAERLVADKKPKVGAKARSFLEDRGVKVITGQKAAQGPDGSWATSDGTKLAADEVFVTVGGKPNTAFLAGQPFLDGRGSIKVNGALQVEGYQNVFAVGDVTDVPETKMGYHAGLHAAAVAANIKTLAKAGSGKPKLKHHKPFGGPEVMMISLGRKAGVAQMGPLVFGGCVPTWIKSSDMLAGMTRKELGMPAKVEAR